MPGHLGARDSHGPGAPRPTSLCLKIEEGEGNWGGERPVGSPRSLAVSNIQHLPFKEPFPSDTCKEGSSSSLFPFPLFSHPKPRPAVGMLHGRNPSPSRTEPPGRRPA